MNKKRLIFSTIAISSVALIGFALFTVAKSDSPAKNLVQTPKVGDRPEEKLKQTETTKNAQLYPTPDVKLSKGQYTQYSESKRSDQLYNRTIVFFYAPWCAQCRAFEKNIKSATVPDGTQILVVDYDSSTALKKQYGVTLQTTFVRVNSDGSEVNKWVGYTSDHTLASLLMQFKV